MEDFSQQLGAILGNPEAMGQIMSVAQSLMGESSPPPQEEHSVPVQLEQMPQVVPANPPVGDFSQLLSMAGGLFQGGDNPLEALSGLDPKLLQIGMQLVGAFTSPMDEKMALLAALRPFVREERFAKVDQAIQMARLAKVARTGLALWKAHKEGGGDFV